MEEVKAYGKIFWEHGSLNLSVTLALIKKMLKPI